MGELGGKTALVTGGTSGIGQDVRALAARSSIPVERATSTARSFLLTAVASLSEAAPAAPSVQSMTTTE
jgi:hypothetical protein